MNLVSEGFEEGEFSAQSPPVGACLGLIHGGCFVRRIQQGATHFNGGNKSLVIQL